MSKRLNTWVAARQMALAGYISRIIEIETGLSYKQIRRLYKELKDNGHTIETSKGTLRGGAVLIKNHTTKLQASLLMQFYYNIGGEEVLSSVNIKALNKAFRLYNQARSEINDQERTTVKLPAFNITDAWCLAAELRSQDAMLERCDACDCWYFTSFNQRTMIQCPYCYTKEQMKNHKHGINEVSAC